MTGIILNNKDRLESKVDISQYTKELKKHWLKILFIVAVVTGGMYPVVSNITDVYSSTASVLIEATEDNITPLSQVEKLDSTQEEYYTTQYELAQSRSVLSDTIKKLKLDENPEFNGVKARTDAGLSVAPEDHTEQNKLSSAIRYIRENLTVTGVRKTQLMLITYENKDAELAADIANSIANSYIDIGVQKRMEKTAAAKEWNEEQNKELKEQILEKQREIQKLLKEENMLTFNGVDGYETEQLALLTRSYAEAKAKKISAAAEYNEAMTYRGSSLEEIITLPMFADNAQLKDLRSSLTQSKRDLYELEKRYGPKHQKIQQANSQIKAINEQTEQLFEELMETVQKRYTAARNEEAQYKALIDEHKKDFHKLASKKDKYYDLQMDLEQMETLYKTLYVRTKEQQLSLNYEKTNAIIYDEAVPADKPLKPNRVFLMIMIAVLVSIITCLVFIIRAATNSKIHSMKELEKYTGIRALGEFRKEKELKNLPIEQFRKAVFGIDNYAEMIHGIRTAIMLDQKQPSRTLGVVSAEDSEGRKTISYLLAHSFSQHRKTALVDLNFRSGESLSNKLVQPSAKGISDICISDCAIEEAAVSLGNLDFYPRGSKAVSPLSVISSKKFEALIESLSARYEQVVFNLPSCKHSKDAQLVAQKIDAVMVVAKADGSTANDILSMMDKLELAGTGVIGGVVNQVEDKNLESEEGLRYLQAGTKKLITADSKSAQSKRS
ncbi:GumC family protein [Vibrio sp. HN007]|uniref:GumC family protein n=1 Tax=Vibrio iocasae TaxID=3098914 RepID=UPI0035D3E4B4